jgi:negative regulator of flagellin synthesis FlgM
MKIGNITSTVATTSIDTDRRSVTQDSSSTSVTILPQDDDSSTQVQLSPEATMLSNASADPSFDSEKVERIAQAIRDGKFTINPGAIADKLIANSQELLGRSGTLN